ncbi:MAG: CysB family HTH-type transcriptional regulator [Betaproteobacteria bacterium]|nr:MAG: CysB family HTH-type transcriptional regulator [Betaproteobacteria bacterium]
MNLQQLRYVTEVARRGLNISAAAAALHTSQPGISKRIRELEEELGVAIFVRAGKRLAALTEPGRAVLEIAARVLAEAANLRRAGRDFAERGTGTLTIATTHTQARYALPRAVAAFKRRYPKVQLFIHQGSPVQICEQVAADEADVGIATEQIGEHPALVALPCYEWNRCVVVPPGHALLRARPLTLEALARHPIVTYDYAYANRSLVSRAFAQRGLAPEVVLTAFDSDVIKTYVELGLGVGILAKMAFDPRRDRALRAIDASHLFPTSTAQLGLRRGAYLRRFAYDFIELFAPRLSRTLVAKMLAGPVGSTYEL